MLTAGVPVLTSQHTCAQAMHAPTAACAQGPIHMLTGVRVLTGQHMLALGMHARTVACAHAAHDIVPLPPHVPTYAQGCTSVRMRIS